MVELKAGHFYKIDFSDESVACLGHNDDAEVVFIQMDGKSRCEIAYTHETVGVCVGYCHIRCLAEY